MKVFQLFRTCAYMSNLKLEFHCSSFKSLEFSIQVFNPPFQSIYDITVGRKKSEAESTFLIITQGRSGQAEVYIRSIPVSAIPTDMEGSSNWVHQFYRDKDEIYDYFVQHGTLKDYGLLRIEIPHNYYA
ncbi:unnamed protein product [Rotaria socialis]|uniref:Acyltransferase C-terminal domain-containing protein n=2 Tax=Rotaria socialis TaxID=392032 RepID=A0A821K311_9BILA|nr:unnamed protein product [Rotaria socialis]